MSIIKDLGKRTYETQNEYTFNRVKRSPINAPNVQYHRVVDGRANVDLSAINPQFKYNFVYINDEQSSYSPSSKIIPKFIYNFVLDGNKTVPFSLYEQFYNSVLVSIPIDTSFEDIYKVNLLYRESDSSNWRLLKVFDKDEISSSSNELTHIFNGGNKLLPVDQSFVNRVYDFVPEKSTDITISENRLFDCGITEGKDLISESDLDVFITEESLPVNISSQRPFSFKLINTVSLENIASVGDTSSASFTDVYILRGNSDDVDNLRSFTQGFGDVSTEESFIYSRGTNCYWMSIGSMAVIKHKFNIVDVNNINFININFRTYIRIDQDDGGTDRKRYVDFVFQWSRENSKSEEENKDILINNLELASLDYHLSINNIISEYSDIGDGYAFETDPDADELPQLFGTDYVESGSDLSFLSYYETHVTAAQLSRIRLSITLDSYPDQVISTGANLALGSTSADNFYYEDNGDKITVQRPNGGELNFTKGELGVLFTLNATGSASQLLHWKNGFNTTFGIRYFDDYGRYTFDLTNDNMSLSLFGAKLATSGIASKVKYNIYHQPPSWAKYYAITVAKRQPQSEYYFLYIHPDNRDDASDELYDENISYAQDGSVIKLKIYNNYIGDDHPNLQSPTWDFQKGDRIRIARIKGGFEPVFFNNDDYFKYDYQIASIEDETISNSGGTDEAIYTILTFNRGSDLSLDLTSLADDNGITDELTNIVFEIYRPQDSTENVSFYECTSRIPIVNGNHGNGYNIDGTGFISGSQSFDSGLPAQGYIEKGNSWFRYKAIGKSSGYNGDVLAVESLYVSDHNISWDTGFDKVGLAANEYSDGNKKYQKIRWTNTYIRDLNINGLSTNDSGDYVNLNPQYGEARGVETFGDTIVAFQDRKVTSYYIGRKQITDASGNSQLITSDAVISTPNSRIEDYGTVFKDSIVRNNRSIYFFDIYNKCMCRYLVNGVQNISSGDDTQSPDYTLKMGKYFKDKSDAIIAAGVENVNVSAVYSELNEILFVTFKSSNENSTINETIGFHEPSGKWVSLYSFVPEKYGKYAEVFCSFEDGKLYKHGTGSTFYGDDIQSEFEFVVNQNPNKKKIFDYLRLHSNKALDIEISTSPNNLYSRGQLTRIYADNMDVYEGQYESEVLSNMLDSNGAESFELLYDGDRMRDYAFKIKLTGTDIELFGVDIGMTYS